MLLTPHTPAQIRRLATLLAHIPVAMLTNHDAEGALHSRPMWLLEIDATGCLWFFTSIKSNKLGFLDRVNLSFTNYSRAIYVSISGHCEIDTDVANRVRLWTPMAKAWFPEGPESPNLALLKFIPARAEYWNSPHCKLVRVLTGAKPAEARRLKSVGEHKIRESLAVEALAVVNE
jgi:general stress protein 26